MDTQGTSLSGSKRTFQPGPGSEVGLNKCPARFLFQVLGDRWSLLVLELLFRGPQRFAELKHALQPVSQRMLVLSLKKLERNGLIVRLATETSPPQVTYRLTLLGASLKDPLMAFHAWTVENKGRIEVAQRAFAEAVRQRRS